MGKSFYKIYYRSLLTLLILPYLLSCSTKKDGNRKIKTIFSKEQCPERQKFRNLLEENDRLKRMLDAFSWTEESLSNTYNKKSSYKSTDSNLLPPNQEIETFSLMDEPSAKKAKPLIIKQKPKKLEPFVNKVKDDIPNIIVEPRLPKKYRTALLLFKGKKYLESAKAFEGLSKSKRFKKSYLKDNIYFWMGECFFQLGQFAQAKQNFIFVLQNNIKGYKNPDALLKVALCEIKLGQKKEANKSLDKILREYPKSDAAKKVKYYRF